MSIFSYLIPKKQTSAGLAKERLQILVAHERGIRGGPDYLPQMREELLNVVRKYVEVDLDSINVQMGNSNGCETLEVNVTLNDPPRKKA